MKTHLFSRPLPAQAPLRRSLYLCLSAFICGSPLLSAAPGDSTQQRGGASAGASRLLSAEPGGGTQLVSVKKIWDAAPHNAFTDLTQFAGQWFCTFREATGHVGGNGAIRVLSSVDGERWESAALLTEEGVDLRDPKFSIPPDGRLMLVMGGSVYEGKVLKERQSRVAFSKDGWKWTAPQRVLEKGDWLWRVTWHKGRAYGISYSQAGKPGADNESAITLVRSWDGVTWLPAAKLAVPGRPTEATVRFLPNGDCVALVRREGLAPNPNKDAWIGSSSAPYTDWRWRSAGMQIGGPNFVVLPDSAAVASGRQYNEKPDAAKTFVGPLTLDSVEPALILPSGGDCSYPGLVWSDGLLWVSYYSSHEGKTSIYLAKVRIPGHEPETKAARPKRRR